MNHSQAELELADNAYHWYMLNLGEHEQPMGSNTGKFVISCQHATWLGGTGWPWCAAAVCRAYQAVGHPLPEPSAGAWDLSDRAIKHGWGARVPLADCKPGFPVCFNVGSGHIAVFEAYDSRKGTVTTLDGNAHDSMSRNTRSAGLVRYAWKVVADKPKPRPKPLFQLVKVTSESGHTVRKIIASADSLKHLWGKIGRK